MTTVRDNVLEATGYAWQRLRERLAGITDDEWRWLPTDDPDLGLRWRLDHIAELLREERNARWLGREPDGVRTEPATDAATALGAIDAAYAEWHGHLGALDDAALQAPVGPLAGPYAAATRLSFVLHVLDELTHHGAEAALLRDLYARRARPAAS